MAGANEMGNGSIKGELLRLSRLRREDVSRAASRERVIGFECCCRLRRKVEVRSLRLAAEDAVTLPAILAASSKQKVPIWHQGSSIIFLLSFRYASLWQMNIRVSLQAAIILGD